MSSLKLRNEAKHDATLSVFGDPQSHGYSKSVRNLPGTLGINHNPASRFAVIFWIHSNRQWKSLSVEKSYCGRSRRPITRYFRLVWPIAGERNTLPRAVTIREIVIGLTRIRYKLSKVISQTSIFILEFHYGIFWRILLFFNSAIQLGEPYK